jgi:hypothetical protein
MDVRKMVGNASFSDLAAADVKKSLSRMHIRFALFAGAAAVAACSSSSTQPAAKPSQLSTVTIVSGNSQTGTAGAALALPIVIQAVDSNGKAAVGLPVIYGPSGNGTVNPSSVVTDSNGKASTVWTLDVTTGQQSLLTTVQSTTTNTANMYFVTDTVFATATP